MNRPNLFILGFPKCGTSSLHSTLISHPSIGEGQKKEPHTYAFEDRYYNRLDYFNKHIDQLSDKKYFLDSSTTYIVNPKAIQLINNDVSNAKFIIVLRDPIDRVVSHFNWLVSLGQVEHSFVNEIERDIMYLFDPIKSENGRYKNYILFSLYSNHLTALSRIIDQKRILLLDYDQLVSQWSYVSKKIYDFLEVHRSAIEFHKKNRTKELIDGNLQINEFSSLGQLKQLRRIILGKKTKKINTELLVKRDKYIDDFLTQYLSKELQLFQRFSNNDMDSSIYF